MVSCITLQKKKKTKVFSLNVYVVKVTMNDVILTCKRLGDDRYELYYFDKINFNTDAQATIMECHSIMKPLRVVCRESSFSEKQLLCYDGVIQCCTSKAWKIEQLQTDHINEWINVSNSSKLFDENTDDDSDNANNIKYKYVY